MFDNLDEEQEQMLANYYSRSMRGESLLSGKVGGENTPGTEDNSQAMFESAKEEMDEL